MRSLRACVAMTLGACASVSTIEPPADAASLAAAESAFAAQGVKAGVREAFLQYLAGDAVLFRPGPVNGREVFEKNPDPPIVLEWRPAHVEVAASGDFGLSAGPWKLTSKADASKPASYGQFVSIWKREGMGPWRVHVDLGISHPQPELWSSPLQAKQLAADAAGGTAEGIGAAEAAFARTARDTGNRAAYAAHASNSIRVYRDGHAPFVGRDAALASPAAALPFAAWTADRVEAARSGDLGYAIGRYADAGSPNDVRGHFVRVWRREGAAWRLALDVTSPVTAKQ